MDTKGAIEGLSSSDPSFEESLITGGVYPPYYRHPDGRAVPKPENWDDIKEKLAQPLPSLSPSEFSDELHAAFIQEDIHADSEDAMARVVGIIAGTIPITLTSVSNLHPLVRSQNLTSARPETSPGTYVAQLDDGFYDALERWMAPSLRDLLPPLPNHSTATKRPDESTPVATRQATYYCSLGSRGLHAIQNNGRQETRYDGKAYTIGATYHNGLLQMFTCHPVSPAKPGDPPSFYMNQLRSFAMRDSAESWREGATWYRNSIQWTTKERNKAIDMARGITPTERLDRVNFQAVTSWLDTAEAKDAAHRPDTPEFMEAASLPASAEVRDDEGEDGDDDEPGPSVSAPAK